MEETRVERYGRVAAGDEHSRASQRLDGALHRVITDSHHHLAKRAFPGDVFGVVHAVHDEHLDQLERVGERDARLRGFVREIAANASGERRVAASRALRGARTDLFLVRIGIRTVLVRIRIRIAHEVRQGNLVPVVRVRLRTREPTQGNAIRRVAL